MSPPRNIIEHLVDVTEQGSISTVAVAATGSGSKQQLSETPPPPIVTDTDAGTFLLEHSDEQVVGDGATWSSAASWTTLEMQVVVEAEATAEVVVETAGAGVGEEDRKSVV